MFGLAQVGCQTLVHLGSASYACADDPKCQTIGLLGVHWFAKLLSRLVYFGHPNHWLAW